MIVGRVTGAAQSWVWDLAEPGGPFTHLIPSPSTFARAAGSLISFDALLQGLSPRAHQMLVSSWGLPEATLEPSAPSLQSLRASRWLVLPRPPLLPLSSQSWV